MATPSLAMIPSGYKAGKVYSVLPESGVGDFDFTRATTATRINSSGLIETVAISVPRLEYPMIDGVVSGCPSLLLEPERLQKIQYSEDFSNAAWAKQNVTITSNSVISPDGTLNADKLTDDSTNGAHRITDAFTTSATGSFTYSIFLKKGTLTTAQFQVFNTATASSANVDLVNGTITSDGAGVDHKIENYGNDWFKCSISGTLSNTTTTVYLYLKQKPNYIGSGDYLYAWGAQFEEGSFSTSYIPNYGTIAGVTRSAETANGAGDASTFNDSEGVLMFEALFDKEYSVSRYISISDSSSSDRVLIGVTGGTNILRAFVFSGGVEQAQIIETIDLSQTIKVSISYKQNEIKFYKNGFLVGEDTSGITPVGLSELAFNAYPASALFYGKTKQIQYFQTVLTDSELEELTSWTSFTDLANGQQYSIK